jgi:hypothetical protein
MRKSIAVLAVLASVAVSAFAAPSISEILRENKAAMGGSAWDAKVSVVVDSDYSGQGMTGTTHTLGDLRTGRSVTDYTVGPAKGANGFDGTTPWLKDSSGTITQQQGGDAIAIAVNEAYRTANKWWLPDYGSATITGDGEKIDSAGQYDVITVTPNGGKAFEAWFDARTHLLAKIVERQGSDTVTTTTSNYRLDGGVLLAHRSLVDRGVGAKYLEVNTVTKVRFEGAQPDAAFAAPKITISDFSIAGGAAQTTVPIKLVNNHIYGDAKVNGRGPFQFVFDTGGHNIVTPPLAKALGLKVEGELAGTGAGEGVMEGGFANGVELEVGDATVKSQLFIVFPLDKLGDIEGIPMPGMVGYETFRRFVTRIDYGARTLTLIDPKHFDPKDAGTPIKFVFNEHVPEVTGTFEGLPAKFDIDTGARGDLAINKPYAEKNSLRATHPNGLDAVDGWGVGGPSRGYVTRAREITLGDVRVKGIVASLTTQDKGAFSGSDFSGNVGAGILKRFVVTFDYGSQLMYLKPLPGPVADIGTFDRVGMWINQSGPGFRVVDVTKNSPAEEAGLRADDLIVAVDGNPAGTMRVYELRHRLRNDAPGTVVTLKVLRGKKYHTYKVTLRDLV